MTWSKRLSNKKEYFFKNIPPLTDLDDYSAEDNIEPPFDGAPKYMCSVYYFWWAYLRENDEYITCCKSGGKGRFSELYADFGDVRDENFFAWWKKTGRELFREQDVVPMRRLFSASDWDQTDGTMLVAVSPIRDVDRLVAEFRRLVRAHYPNGQWSKTAQLDIGSTVAQNLRNLYILLRAYQLKKQHSNWTQENISDYLDLIIAGKEPQDGKLPSLPPKDAGVKDAIRAEMSRRLRYAKAIIRNVAEGRFPDNRLNA